MSDDDAAADISASLILISQLFKAMVIDDETRGQFKARALAGEAKQVRQELFDIKKEKG